MFDGFPISDEFSKLLVLPCKLEEIPKIDPTKNANDEFNNQRELTSQLTSSVKQECRETVSEENIKNYKCTIKKKRMDKHRNILNQEKQCPGKIKTTFKDKFNYRYSDFQITVDVQMIFQFSMAYLVKKGDFATKTERITRKYR